MKTASANYEKLNSLLTERGVDVDTRCGIVISLNTDANYNKMITWINAHPCARQTEIMRQMFNILGMVAFGAVNTPLACAK